MNLPNSSINVKQLRESRNLTIRKVAIALDVADSTIYRWEAGVVKPQLTFDKIQIMLDLFQCDFSLLRAAFHQTEIEGQAASDSATLEQKRPVAA